MEATSLTADVVARAERATLGAVIESRAAYEKVAKILDGSAFADPRHELIWDAVRWVNEQGTPDEPARADETLVMLRLHETGHLEQVGGADYLVSLVEDNLVASNAPFYARQVLNAARARALSNLGTKLQQAGKAAVDPAEQDNLITQAMEHLEALGAETGREDPTALLALELPATMDALEGEGTHAVRTGLTDLDNILGGMAPGQVIVVAARPGVGKALALDTPIPTPTGWTTMGEVCVGEQVLGMDGKPTTVVAATDVMHDHEVYRVDFSDGTHVLADADHLWLTALRAGAGEFEVRTTAEILQTVHTDVGLPNHYVPAVEPLDLPDQVLPVSPYELGRWFTAASNHNRPHPVVGDTIPAEYLRASVTQRRALLAGLVDGAGFPMGRGSIAVMVSAALRPTVASLLRTLGYHAQVSNTLVTFTAHDNPFRHPDLRAAFSPGPAPRRYITDVTPVESVPVRCIQVDNTDHMYLAGDGLVPTHNTVMAQALAENVAIKQKRPVLGFTLEMTRMEMMARVIASVCRINSRAVNFARPNLTDADWVKIADKMDAIQTMPLHICDDSTITPARISALIGAFKRKHPDLGMVFIDYLQLMQGDDKASNRQEEVARITRAIKLTAKRHGVPIVLLSQLNRKSADRASKRPELTDLRESGAIEQDADVVLLLHREDAIDPESPRAGEMDVEVAKHRGGPTGLATVAAQMHYYTLTDLSRQTEPATW